MSERGHLCKNVLHEKNTSTVKAICICRIKNVSYQDFAVDAVSEWEPVEDLREQTSHLGGEPVACQG